MRAFPGELLYSTIRPMRADDAPVVAHLHCDGIPTGFLSSLGPKFLAELYATVSSCPSSFAFVSDLGDEPVGFVACATSTGRLYKEALKRSAARLTLRMLPNLWRPSTIKNSLQTLLYPSAVNDDIPRAEILSVAVAEPFRGRGFGKALMRRALAGLRGRGIERVRVAVWSENQPARALYHSCGFGLADVREHHGLPMLLYVASTEPASAPARFEPRQWVPAAAKPA